MKLNINITHFTWKLTKYYTNSMQTPKLVSFENV